MIKHEYKNMNEMVHMKKSNFVKRQACSAIKEQTPIQKSDDGELLGFLLELGVKTIKDYINNSDVISKKVQSVCCSLRDEFCDYSKKSVAGLSESATKYVRLRYIEKCCESPIDELLDVRLLHLEAYQKISEYIKTTVKSSFTSVDCEKSNSDTRKRVNNSHLTKKHD